MKKPAETLLPVNRLAQAAFGLREATLAHYRDTRGNIPAGIAPAWSEFYDALEATNKPLVMPKDKTAGLANFVRMIIDDLDNGDLEAARYRAIDLWNDIGTIYVVK